jgi:predicted acylesterase/phospholipase RssA
MPKKQVTDKQRNNSEGMDKRLANLRPFQPGQSGNPKGRPKSITLSEAYRKMLAAVDETDPEKRTHAEVLAEQMYAKAKTGDVSALKEIADRVEGKARQTVALTLEKREQLEQAIAGIMRDAETAGEPCSREEAIAALSIFRPEVSDLLN